MISVKNQYKFPCELCVSLKLCFKPGIPPKILLHCFIQFNFYPYSTNWYILWKLKYLSPFTPLHQHNQTLHIWYFIYNLPPPSQNIPHSQKSKWCDYLWNVPKYQVDIRELKLILGITHPFVTLDMLFPLQ